MKPASTAKRGRPAGALRRHEATADETGMTLQAIADQLGITREGARQAEARALHKLVRELQRRGYRASDFFD